MAIILTGAVCSLAACAWLNRISQKIDQISEQNEKFWEKHTSKNITVGTSAE